MSFGEMAFLLERPRSQHVYAISNGVRVLGLSDGTLPQMNASDPAIAPHLLLNISTMVCLRLLKTQ
jgi:CRP-like cAMP-binding protein